MNFNKTLIAFGLAILSQSPSASAQSPRDQLTQMVAQLQRTPTDDSLRASIIVLGLTIKPAPAIPEDARRPFVRANTALKNASGNEDYRRAIELYKEALVAAPWWSDAYYNLANAQELNGDFREAIASLKLFILGTPSYADIRPAQDQIYALEERLRDKTIKATAKIENVNRPANEKVFCVWPAAFGGAGTLLEMNYTVGSITYLERSSDGHDTAPIVSKPNVTDTNISWTQAETFPSGYSAVVSYSLSRISGDLNYSYMGSNGEQRTTRYNCSAVKPKF